jgi:tripartite-type tricarboxylate transporter receptor subunit TctC
MPGSAHHQVLVVGGGTAGITVAAILKRRAPGADIAIIEPSPDHYYQPAFTLVGAGIYPLARTRRAEESLIPVGVRWIRDAAEMVVRAPPDGYTLLQIISAVATNPWLYPNLSFDFIRDIRPVATTTRSAFVMVVNPDFPAKTIPDFIAYGKANPGKINMASSGIGITPHIFGQLFMHMAGIDAVHVPYRGGAPAITALIAGQVQVYFSPLPEPLEQIRAGKLRALGVTTATRSDALPNVPSIGEFVPGYEAAGWQGIGAPKDTPDAIVEKLNAATDAVLADPAIKARLADMAITAYPSTPAEFAALIAGETQKWGKVIRDAGIKPE